jgi:hypothetical protein
MCVQKEAQACPLPSPIGFIGAKQGSFAHTVWKICRFIGIPIEIHSLQLIFYLYYFGMKGRLGILIRLPTVVLNVNTCVQCSVADPDPAFQFDTDPTV